MTREEIIADLNLTPDEAVAAVKVHLNAGRIGLHGLFSDTQMDYRACWHEVIQLLSQWEGEPGGYDERHVREFRAVLNRLAAFRPADPGVYAVTTAYHGKDTAFQNHQAFEDAA